MQLGKIERTINQNIISAEEKGNWNDSRQLLEYLNVVYDSDLALYWACYG